MSKAKSSPDILLIASTIALLIIGVVIVYSSSAVLAHHELGDSLYYLKRQALFALLGIIAMFTMMKLEYWVLKEWAFPILVTCFVLLILVLIPGIGLVRGGARSWIGIGAFSIQPSEFVKLAIIIFAARWLAENQKKMIFFSKGFLPMLLLSGAAFVLIMLQPDLGTGVVLMGTVIVMLFAAGARIQHLSFLVLLGIIGFVALILAAPYRIDRILGFLDPWQDPRGTGYQIIQSLYAIGPGGLMGLGLGNSLQKFYYLPEPYNDFIFSILAEELGFIGGCTVLILFSILLWRGMRTAITAPDLFGSFLAVGITGMIAIQVIINIGVVTGIFPVTGITLPLISAGGSSLTLMLTGLGILLNISRYSR